MPRSTKKLGPNVIVASNILDACGDLLQPFRFYQEEFREECLGEIVFRISTMGAAYRILDTLARECLSSGSGSSGIEMELRVLGKPGSISYELVFKEVVSIDLIGALTLLVSCGCSTPEAYNTVIQADANDALRVAKEYCKNWAAERNSTDAFDDGTEYAREDSHLLASDKPHNRK